MLFAKFFVFLAADAVLVGTAEVDASAGPEVPLEIHIPLYVCTETQGSSGRAKLYSANEVWRSAASQSRCSTRARHTQEKTALRSLRLAGR